MQTYHIEVTDTFGGEANYCWRKQWLVRANSEQGAISKLGRREGRGWRKAWDAGDFSRYNLQGAAVCAFVQYVDDLSLFDGVTTI